jgi:hypothetical protein
MSLQEALLGMDREKRSQAEGIYNNELARDLQERQFVEQQRQFNENLRLQREQMAAQERAARAASGGGGGYSLGGGSVGGGGGSAPASQGRAPSYGFKNGKNGAAGFWFVDSNGRPISAAKYAQMTGANLSQLVNKMGAAGDRTAASLMKGPGINVNSNIYRRAFAWDL